MCPNGKKIELFGRPHNCRENWITLGNQLPGVFIKDETILSRYYILIIIKIDLLKLIHKLIFQKML